MLELGIWSFGRSTFVPPELTSLGSLRKLDQSTRNLMSLDLELQKFPKKIVLKDKLQCSLRPLKKDDEKKFHDFFLEVPEQERMFIKHRVTDPKVIKDW